MSAIAHLTDFVDLMLHPGKRISDRAATEAMLEENYQQTIKNEAQRKGAGLFMSALADPPLNGRGD